MEEDRTKTREEERSQLGQPKDFEETGLDYSKLKVRAKFHDEVNVIHIGETYVCLVAQLCPSLCDPMGCSPPGSSVHGDSPGKNTGMDCYTLLQGIFLTQGSNPGLLHCRQILYYLSHQGSPFSSPNDYKYIHV